MMKYLLAALFALASAARAADISPPQNVTIIFQNVALSGICGTNGTNCVEVTTVTRILGNSPDGVSAIFESATQGFGQLVAIASTGTPTGVIGLVVSTGTDFANDTVAQLIYDTATGDVVVSGGANAGTIYLRADGSIELAPVGAAVNLNGNQVHLGASVPVTANHALCVNASGNLSSCTTVVSGTGTCTCP